MNKKMLKEEVKNVIRGYLGTHDMMTDRQLNESLAALNIPLLTESVIDELQNGDASILLYKQSGSSSYTALVKHKSLFVAFTFEYTKYKSSSSPMPYSGASDYAEQLANDGYLRVSNDTDVKMFYDSIGEQQSKAMLRALVMNSAIAIFTIILFVAGIAFAPQIGSYLGSTFPGFFTAIQTGFGNFVNYLKDPVGYATSVSNQTSAAVQLGNNETAATAIISGIRGMFK